MAENPLPIVVGVDGSDTARRAAYGGFTGMLLGSASRKLAAHTTPVAVVPDR